MKDSEIRYYFNGESKPETTNTTFLEAGKVGL